MKNQILAVVLGAIVFFMWGFPPWTILPWHKMVVNDFQNESAVAEAVKANTKSGVYFLPSSNEAFEKGRATTVLAVRPDGPGDGKGKYMIIGLILNLLSAGFILLLLRQCGNARYWSRVGFAALLGLSIGFITQTPLWNVYGYPLYYVGVKIADSVLCWSLAGLVMAKFVKPAGS